MKDWSGYRVEFEDGAFEGLLIPIDDARIIDIGPEPTVDLLFFAPHPRNEPFETAKKLVGYQITKIDHEAKVIHCKANGERLV